MRVLLAGGLLFIFAAQQQMVAPKVEHKKHEQTTTYEEVIRSCPEGYEGHFVDYQIGFGPERFWGSGGVVYFTIGEQYGDTGYTVCFKKEFMDEIRKNPELFAPRPAPPRPA